MKNFWMDNKQPTEYCAVLDGDLVMLTPTKFAFIPTMVPINTVQEYIHPDGPPLKDTQVPSIRFEEVKFEGRDVYILDGDFVWVGQGKAALKKALDLEP